VIPSLVRLYEAKRDRPWWLLVQSLLHICGAKVAICRECALAGKARGVLVRRRTVAPVSLASTGASISLKQRRWLVQTLLPQNARVARWSPACGERALAGRARDARMKRGMSAPVSLAGTGASLSWSACEAQRDRQWWLQVRPLLTLCARAAKWLPACGECALAGRARDAHARRGVSASVSLASTGTSLSWSAVRGTAR
jgi:hypothetical protein